MKEMHACTPHRCMHRSKALLETRRSHTFAVTVQQMHSFHRAARARRVRPARGARAGCCPRAANSREKTAPPASRAASAQPLRTIPAAMKAARGTWTALCPWNSGPPAGASRCTSRHGLAASALTGRRPVFFGTVTCPGLAHRRPRPPASARRRTTHVS
eukprot:COSAG05_NODE_2480_length_3009_cov_3.316495_2_plen_159_part_00